MNIYHRWDKRWNNGPAGLLCLAWGRSDGDDGERLGLHMLVRRSSWVWGYESRWYDGPHHLVGLGPLFLLAWSEA